MRSRSPRSSANDIVYLVCTGDVRGGPGMQVRMPGVMTDFGLDMMQQRIDDQEDKVSYAMPRMVQHDQC